MFKISTDFKHNYGVFIVDLEQVNAGWVSGKFTEPAFFSTYYLNSEPFFKYFDHPSKSMLKLLIFSRKEVGNVFYGR